jgi:virginiamycin B lyase
MNTRLITTLLAAALAWPAQAILITETPVDADYATISVDPGGVVYVANGSGVSYFGESSLGGFNVNGSSSLNLVVATRSDLWIGDSGSNQIFRIPRIAGTVTPIPIPTPSAGLAGMCLGPDGSLWFTEFTGNRIGRIARNGTVTEFPLPTASSGPYGIAAGSDGAVWFTEYAGNRIGRITTEGVISEVNVKTAGAHPTGIAVYSYFVMFTESSTNKIGQYNLGTSNMYEATIPTAASTPWDIVHGPDGSFFFTERTANKIGRIYGTSLAFMSETPVPTAASEPTAIALAPDGSIWFTELAGKNIGHLVLSAPGDMNADGNVDVADVFFLINFLFAGGSAPK